MEKQKRWKERQKYPNIWIGMELTDGNHLSSRKANWERERCLNQIWGCGVKLCHNFWILISWNNSLFPYSSQSLGKVSRKIILLCMERFQRMTYSFHCHPKRSSPRNLSPKHFNFYHKFHLQISPLSSVKKSKPFSENFNTRVKVTLSIPS